MEFVLGDIGSVHLAGRHIAMAALLACAFSGLSTQSANARSPAVTSGWATQSTPTATGSIEMPKAPPAPERKPAVPRADRDGKAGRSASTKSVRNRTAGVTFEPIAFQDLPGWAEDDHLAALKAFQSSCPQVVAGKAGRSVGEGAAALVEACKTAMALPPKMTRQAARLFLESQFRPHRILHSASEGLLTGYYEPVIEGSRTPQGKFQTPLLKRPPDLVTIPSGSTRGALHGSLTHAQRTPDGLAPFATRAEIASGALAGKNLELLYLASPVDKYFLQIQGAGRIRLQDGSFVRVQYDGKNGHPYRSIGRYLIDKGLLAADKMSMGALGRWLKADLDRAREVMNQNASYVFFREMPADARGPQGAFEVTLIAGRSVAIDPSVHRLGSFVYVSGPTLTPPGHARPFNRLMVAHDVGGAIKGPERADIYFGTGDRAEAQASGVRHPGHLYALVPTTARFEPAAERKAAGKR